VTYVIDIVPLRPVAAATVKLPRYISIETNHMCHVIPASYIMHLIVVKLQRSVRPHVISYVIHSSRTSLIKRATSNKRHCCSTKQATVDVADSAEENKVER